MSKSHYIVLILILLAAALYFYENQGRDTVTPVTINDVSGDLQEAYFAGGCFWCVESDFESKSKGIKEVISGYMGGEGGAKYEEVASGSTGHRETVRVVYDPKIVTYEDLVRHFFKIHDPTDSGGSFFDRGHQYTSAIYYRNDEEKQIADNVIAELTNSNTFPKPIVTTLTAASEFHQAEDYHQDYHEKNPVRYQYYRQGSGRDNYIDSIWGEVDKGEVKGVSTTNKMWENYQKPSDDVLKSKLSDVAYKVTQKDGTEKPRSDGNHDKNYEEGIYVDVLSGEPLFSSTHKFDSGTGWPSFYQPIDPEFIVEKDDRKLFVVRTEIRSNYADNHLGHVFEDGPEPTGLRYCMNGAALRFIPRAEMEQEGYGDYLYLFENKE